MLRVLHSINNSFRHNYIGILLMVMTSLCVACGQFLWKISGSVPGLAMCAGFVLYGSGALMMTQAFRYGKLSVLHPLLCLSYVFSVLIGWHYLGESLHPLKGAGLATIICGVILISGGDE